MALCKCKYNWPVIGGNCIACGQILSPYDGTTLPDPPVTMDQIADAVKFIIHGPNEKVTNNDSNLPDSFSDCTVRKIPPKGTKVLVRKNETQPWIERLSLGWYDCGDCHQSPGLVCYSGAIDYTTPLDESCTFIWQEWKEIDNDNI